MRLFRREEENFDDSAAFENDRGIITKIILGFIILIFVFVIIGFIIYNQYPNLTWDTFKFNLNNDQNNTLNIIQENISEEIIVNFTNFNLSVKPNPGGVYYFTTQDKVVEEKCYINGRKKNCKSLTNKVCAEEECIKNLVIVKQCFVNNEKINCPELDDNNESEK